MSRWGKPTKNKRRRDPRYHLAEVDDYHHGFDPEVNPPRIGRTPTTAELAAPDAPSGDTPEDVARELLESGQEITEETATQAALNAGVLDDELYDFVEAILAAAEAMTLRTGTPKTDPLGPRLNEGINLDPLIELLSEKELDEGFGDWAKGVGSKIGSAAKSVGSGLKTITGTDWHRSDPTPGTPPADTSIDAETRDFEFGAGTGGSNIAVEKPPTPPAQPARDPTPLEQHRTAQDEKYKSRMGFSRDSPESEQYMQDIALTSTPGMDTPALRPQNVRDAFARREQYKTGGGGYGQEAGFQPALAGRNVLQKTGAFLRGRGFRESAQIKDSELRQLVEEELEKALSEAAPGTMGTPRGMQTDYVRDAPAGETEWKETAFQAADADTGKIYTSREGPSDNPSWLGKIGQKLGLKPRAKEVGQGGRLADRAGIDRYSMAKWAADNPSRYAIGGETGVGMQTKTRTAPGEEDTNVQSGFGTDRTQSYQHRGNVQGELIKPEVGYFGGDINAPNVMKPRYGAQVYGQQTWGDYAKPGGIQPGEKMEYGEAPGQHLTAPEAGNYQVYGAYDLGQTGRARQRDIDRFEQGVDPEGNPMFESTQIKGSELKQIVQEELISLMQEVTSKTSDVAKHDASVTPSSATTQPVVTPATAQPVVTPATAQPAPDTASFEDWQKTRQPQFGGYAPAPGDAPATTGTDTGLSDKFKRNLALGGGALVGGVLGNIAARQAIQPGTGQNVRQNRQAIIRGDARAQANRLNQLGGIPGQDIKPGDVKPADVAGPGSRFAQNRPKLAMGLGTVGGGVLGALSGHLFNKWQQNRLDQTRGAPPRELPRELPPPSAEGPPGDDPTAELQEAAMFEQVVLEELTKLIEEQE